MSRTYFGPVLIAVGPLTALVLALWPVSFDVLGSTVDCGPGLVAFTNQSSDDGLSGDLVAQCETESQPRVLTAGLILLVTAGAGVGISIAEGSW